VEKAADWGGEEREARDWGEEALGKVRVFTVFFF
jgi:hypothetical protein